MTKMNDPSGLDYVQDFINQEEEKKLIEFINSQPWRVEKKRRMQTYGFRYMKGEHHMELHKVDPIPDIIVHLMEKVQDFFHIQLNQCTINEYKPGQGIDAHYDHKERFGKDIVGLSLGSGCEMIFESEKNLIRSIYLEPRSMYRMTEKYRYDYTHRIKGQVEDTINGESVPRKTRISLTFRFCK